VKWENVVAFEGRVQVYLEMESSTDLNGRGLIGISLSRSLLEVVLRRRLIDLSRGLIGIHLGRRLVAVVLWRRLIEDLWRLGG